MSLINKEKLMQAMYHRAFETDEDTMWMSGCWVRYRAIEDVIKSQPEQPERMKGEWIPCSEAFPKKDGDYLVTTYNGQLARYIFTKGNSEDYWTRCVTAWMPLPEPYKGEQNG